MRVNIAGIEFERAPVAAFGRRMLASVLAAISLLQTRVDCRPVSRLDASRAAEDARQQISKNHGAGAGIKFAAASYRK